MAFKKLRHFPEYLVIAVLALLTACTRPIHDQSALKAIKAEARVLMATQQTKTNEVVPESRWPRTIANLKPKEVTISSDGVYIGIKPYFDGGWGYFVSRREGKLPEPVDRFSELGQGIYWYQPY